MTTQPPSPSSTLAGAGPSRPRRDFTTLAALALAIVTAGWLFAWWEPVPVGADAPGYYVAGRMLAVDGSTVLVPGSPTQYLGPHWLDPGDRRFVSRYPPGVPFLVSLLYRVGGAGFAPALNPLLAAVAVFLVVLWARRWMPALQAVVSGAIVASLAAVGEQSLLGFSHLPTTTALLGALYFADRWSANAGRGDAFLMGLLAGIIPTLRYPEALLTILLGAWALLHVRSARHTRSLPWAAVGALLPIGLLLLHNQWLFGSPFSTGYGLTGEAQGFAPRYFVAHFVPYLGTLLRNAGPSFVLGGAGVLYMLLRGGHQGRVWLLLGVVGLMTTAYMAFFWPFADVRFLLPTLPVWVVSAAWLTANVRSPRLAMVLLLVLVGGHAALAVGDTIPRTRRIAAFGDRMRLASDAVRSHVQAGSVVIAPGAFQSMMEYRGDWKLADWTVFWSGPLPPRPTGVPAPLSADGRPQPSPQQTGKGEGLRRRYAGMGETQRIHAALGDAFEWAGGRPVVWIGDERWIAEASKVLAPHWRMEQLATIELPPAGTRWREEPWWLPSLPVGVYRVHGAPDNVISAPAPLQ